MAAHTLCSRVIGTPDCTDCRRNPANGHPTGGWGDSWREPDLEAAWPRTICKSRDAMPVQAPAQN